MSPDQTASSTPEQPSLVALTTYLVAHPTATMAEIATAVGCSRSTLHRRFPNRADLIRAIEAAAVAHVTDVYVQADIEHWFGGTESPEPALSAFVHGLVELGPQLLFLYRSRPESTWSHDEMDAFDAQVLAAMARGQEHGMLTPRLSAAWLMGSLYALIYAAWEQVAAGRVAAQDAAPFVVESWWAGTKHPHADT